MSLLTFKNTSIGLKQENREFEMLLEKSCITLKNHDLSCGFSTKRFSPLQLLPRALSIGKNQEIPFEEHNFNKTKKNKVQLTFASIRKLSESVPQRCSVKRAFLKILQNSQEKEHLFYRTAPVADSELFIK